MQFLSNVLSQRGPTSLPYSEDTKWLIRQHLLSLSDSCPSLQPKTAIFTHNDGRTVNLLQADGTVPIVYSGVTYNIPVVIWLMESYPRHPPLVFVNPTRDMIIKRPHPNVTPSGSVSIPYLQNWIYPSSNLVDLAKNLSHCFGKDPPLYSQRRPQQSLSQSTNPSFGHGQNPSSSFGSGSVGGPGRVFPPSPYVGSGRIFPPSPQQPGLGVGAGVGVATDDPNEVFKRNATNKIVEMVHGDLVGLKKAREGEMDGLFNSQGALRMREGELNRGVKEMMDEKEGLEQQLQMVLMNADVLEEWLRENKEKLGKMDSVDVDNAFEPCDGLSKQLLEVSALDLAIEDVIYSLDKAIQDGTIPFDQYLKNVRLLSREQFFHRAMAMKIRGVQMQAHVSSMAARTSQYTLT